MAKTSKKVLKKYFFGCFVTTTSLILHLSFYPLLGTIVLQNIQKILLQHFFACLGGTSTMYGQNNQESAAKVFFGCFVPTRNSFFLLNCNKRSV